MKSPIFIGDDPSIGFPKASNIGPLSCPPRKRIAEQEPCQGRGKVSCSCHFLRHPMPSRSSGSCTPFRYVLPSAGASGVSACPLGYGLGNRSFAKEQRGLTVQAD